ncbi:unnamed protein product [Paramecium octaurelia]|uniref:Uncharacterized protein n=1 Tax=Paramecium octaurelia TaxID=43137 RepID=A0A8S1X4H1_PAROT|nr:unnamed protein product [Paramecium octaurelia]
MFQCDCHNYKILKQFLMNWSYINKKTHNLKILCQSFGLIYRNFKLKKIIKIRV